MSKEISDADRQAFFEDRNKTEAENVDIDEEELAGKAFKKTTPRVLTPQEVRDEGTAKPYTPLKRDDDTGESRWPAHQSVTLQKDKRESYWEEGTYEVLIDRTFIGEGEDIWNLTDKGAPKDMIHVGFVAKDGKRIQKRMTKSFSDKSTLYAFTMAVLGVPPDGINTDDLVGKTVRVLVKNIPNKKGDVWETITEFLASKDSFKAGA
jgi:hypothetical protein